MARINSRSKGQVGEREVADLLNAGVFRATGVYGDFKRNLQQTQDGGFDLCSEAFPFFAIEVKRVESLTPALVESYWAQAKRQATVTAGKALLPILIYRQNRRPWRVRTYGQLAWDAERSVVVEVSVEAFTLWFEAQIKRIHDRRTT